MSRSPTIIIFRFNFVNGVFPYFYLQVFLLLIELAGKFFYIIFSDRFVLLIFWISCITIYGIFWIHAQSGISSTNMWFYYYLAKSSSQSGIFSTTMWFYYYFLIFQFLLKSSGIRLRCFFFRTSKAEDTRKTWDRAIVWWDFRPYITVEESINCWITGLGT